MIVQVCRKHLLYANPCATALVRLSGGKGWVTVDSQLTTPAWRPWAACRGRPC
jgi:hypothetical protein